LKKGDWVGDIGASRPFVCKFIKIHTDFTKIYSILMPSQGRAIERSKMKKRLVVTSLAIAALFASTNIAVADAQSDYQLALQQYKTAVSNWNATNKADQDAYKLAMKTWNDAKKSADQARKVIADKFKSDADAIKARTAAAVAAAANAKDKKAASTSGKLEMDAAILARNNALAVIPTVPAEPVKPTPAASPTPPAKPAQSAKPKPTDSAKPKPGDAVNPKPAKSPKA